MSSFEEVQQLEIEAIESLYSFENEFLRLSHNSFQLNLKSSPTFQNSSISLKNKKVTLHISYPKEYPQVLPDWSLNKCMFYCRKKNVMLSNAYYLKIMFVF
jgi:hypothetical protein